MFFSRSSDSTRTPSNRNSSSAGGGLVTPENSSAPRTPSAPKAKGSKSSSSTGGASESGGNGGSSGAAASGGKKSSNSVTPTNAFQSYLSNLSPEAGAGRSLNIDLSAALAGSEAVNDLISDPERVNTLSVHLPESEDADENKKQQIKDTIASPQFQQALSLFSNALQSAQLGPVVSQFELTPEAVAAAYSGNLEDFVKALEKSLPTGTTMSASPTSSKGKVTAEVKKEEGEESTEKKE